MRGERLRHLRVASGLTQAELGARAGVSRQLIGAIEAGRHRPGVDAALALARALGVAVEDAFAEPSALVAALTGETPAEGAAVRAGLVGDRTVTAAARVGLEGWDAADGVVEEGRLRYFRRLSPGVVVSGCEPGLQVLEHLLRQRGHGAVAVASSSEGALSALAGGRVHAAVVHASAMAALRPPDTVEVDRIGLARWRVGLASPSDAPRDWWREALAGRTPVIQREAGAGVQRAFEKAAGGATVPGPVVATHLEAARRSVTTGMAAVTMEPAALAVGAAFHPLEEHEAQLWVDHRWLTDRVVTDALTVLTSEAFRRRLSGIGGYDLTQCGAALS